MGAEGMKGAATAMVQDWLMSHDLTLWLMSHPIWGLGFIFLSVFLLWGLLRAIAQFIETLWLIVLRSPLNFGRWLVKTVRRLFNSRRLEADSTETPTPQIDEIAERLERLQEEQKQLLLDVKLLIAQQKKTDMEGDRT